ncbi:MAG TPA: phospholipid carrier-dependent glycosyltransferase [Chloroflexia bacterium]|nr:phospholipid carrier-dependent glycosyltransferase [Chloroflexia bacterium]
MKQDLAEKTIPLEPEASEQPVNNLKNGLRWLTALFAGLFILALAVQLLRGKLWLVGPAGVWLLLLATIISAVASFVAERRSQQGTIAERKRLSSISPFTVVVVALTLLGFWLRVWGQRNGLPYIIPSDENLIVDVGTRILKTGNFDPQMYYYPSFYLYLEAIVGISHFIWGSFTGLYTSVNDLPDKTFAITTAPQMYLWERTFTALVGTAAIPLAYIASVKLWKDRRVGVLAAGFVTFSALATEHSHYVAVDMPTATLALAALWPAWNIVEKGRRRDYIIAGIVAGLASATKWNGVTVIALPLLAHLLRQIKTVPAGTAPLPWVGRRYFTPELLITLLATGLTFLVTTPYIFARIKGYSDAFGTNITKYRLSTVEYATDTPWLGNLQTIWQDSLMLFVLGIAGVILLFLRRRLPDLLVLSFPLIYLLSINGYRLIYQRNVLPLTIYFALLAAVFSIWIFDRLVERLPQIRLNSAAKRAAGIALPALFIYAVMSAPLSGILYGDNFNAQPFSYDRAEAWLKTNVGPGPLKLVEMRPQQWGDYPNTISRAIDNGANDFPLQYYRERGIQYLAINRDRVAGENSSGSYPELLQPSLIAQEFETKAINMPGPAFTIVKTGVTPETLKLQHPLQAEFGSYLRLLGVNAGPVKQQNELYLPPKGEIKSGQDWPHFKAGEIIGLSVYWQVLNRLPQDYVVYIHLQPEDKPDTNSASRDTQPFMGVFPTSQWKPGELLTDTPNLALPANLPPGKYNLVMGLYQNDGKFTPLPLADGAGSITLGTVNITK